ncbi:ATP-binding protein [Mucilaginibacter boryungensis]|uniref:ATP-binding protein n=1 Tax=Mucilaginibacter boryungensis TaxID=768480 RepID=A0ABR9XDB5_9SPHI|nr:ATP-binding protein [Mucilaginibacter boryungensis]MBE9665387.1 ATP-binding protein [Mucilaginibacter boryungensis]
MEDYSPVIGKTVIETLTSGMYDDARFVFREYVQNAADQIDVAFETNVLRNKADGRVKITIDPFAKYISVEDNATGIPASEVLRFLGDVAKSEKDKTKRKGFRGIGRLGGLGYCDKLIFETSAHGEDVQSIMTLDAKQLRKLIEDNNVDLDASAVISVITSIDRKSEAKDEHYFKVTLENVNTIKLLDIKRVTEYLSMVAPLPFHKDFTFGKEVKRYMTENNFTLDEYNVFLNNDQLFKSYRDEFDEDDTKSKWLAVDFFDVRGEKLELLALGWYGYRAQSNIVLPTGNIEKGLRLRKSNIGIGDENTVSRFFKAPRTNHRFIGEIHALNSNFIPNARRDYFNENRTLQDFEKALEDLFKEKNLENRLAHTASNLQRRLEEIEDYKRSQKEWEERKGNFPSQVAEQQFLDNLKVAETTAKRAYDTINKISVKASKDKGIKTLYQTITAGKDLDISTSKDLTVNTYDPPSFAKLSPNEQEVVRTIFQMIDETLPVNQAKTLKDKIYVRFN